MDSRSKISFNNNLGFIFGPNFVIRPKTLEDVSQVLLQLAKFDYSSKLCDEKTASNIISILCDAVPCDNDKLVSTFATLIFDLISKQELVLVHNINKVSDYLLRAIRVSSHVSCNSLLRALGAVLYENGAHVEKFVEDLAGTKGILRELLHSGNDVLIRSAVQCVENLCIRVPNQPYLSGESQALCLSLFIDVLHTTKAINPDDINQCKIFISALRGLQHMFITSKSCPVDQLGTLLAAIKSYMLFGLPEAPLAVSTCLHPMPLGAHITAAPTNKQQSHVSTATPTDDVSLRPGAAAAGAAVTGAAAASAKAKPGTQTETKAKKNKKKRGGRKEKQESNEDAANQNVNQNSSDATILDQSFNSLQLAPPSATNVTFPGGYTDPLSLYPAWSKASSSDSEFSDTELTGGAAGVSAKSRSFQVKVRQTALGCFHALVKASERRVMFGYWSSFLPSTFGQGTSSTLFTVILKDPSSKARTGALAVLTALLEGTRQYLQAAEDSEQYRNAPFTPFSVTLGYMIKEIHRCLMLALTTEQSPIATTQVIKCLATLIPCVPYNRLRPGLLTRVMKQIKPFMVHRDPNIRVACLSCLGAMVAVQAPLLEVTYILQATRTNTRTSDSTSTSALQTTSTSTVGTPAKSGSNACVAANATVTDCTPMADNDVIASAIPVAAATPNESGYATGDSLSSATSGAGLNRGQTPSTPRKEAPSSELVSEISTPYLSSGSITPSLSDVISASHLSNQLQQHQAGAGGSLSWVIRLCIRNTAPQLLDKRDDATTAELSRSHGGGGLASASAEAGTPARVPVWPETTATRHVQPLPVRLESLQVLTAMCKGYFQFISNVLGLISDVIRACLEDSDISVQLHGAKLLDECGSVMSHKLQETTVSVDLPLDQVVLFWRQLLNGPVPSALQTSTSVAVQSTLCDALSAVCNPVFEQLERPLQILCMTLTLGMTSGDEQQVRASAVRTLGVYVFMPCLRHNVSFVSDAASAIIALSGENQVAVKVKAMWSLGNLTDAIATIKESGTAEAVTFSTQFDDSLLLRLFHVAAKGSLDSDKVRSNAVRALGNLLRYLPEKCLDGGVFTAEVIQNGVAVLVKNITSGAMKVRWNACYAVGNMLKNDALAAREAPWLISVLDALQSAVKQCKNFKVRINAALSLGIPTHRVTYGTQRSYIQVWESLVECLHSSDTTADLAEFKYSEALNIQVLSTLLHLLRVMTSADVPLLHVCLAEHRTFLAGHVQRYSHRIEGYDVTVIRDHVNSLQTTTTTSVASVTSVTSAAAEISESTTSASSVACLRLLLEIFTPPRESDEAPPQTPPTRSGAESPVLQSGFRQTYD